MSCASLGQWAQAGQVGAFILSLRGKRLGVLANSRLCAARVARKAKEVGTQRGAGLSEGHTAPPRAQPGCGCVLSERGPAHSNKGKKKGTLPISI